MADFRPFPALRYHPTVAGDASTLVAPPYDVVSPERQAELHARSPYNISNVDYGEAHESDSPSDNRYTRARAAIQRWIANGALLHDRHPRLYVYDQQFTLGDALITRRAIFGRLRLEEWDRGIVLPHEHTRAAAKADRLELIRSTRVHLSPIMAMYRRTTSQPLTDDSELGPTLLDAVLPGERHILRPMEGEGAAYVCRTLASQKLYIADGHHRYETALFYRDECRAKASSWTGEEPENFVLAALVDADDPGLVILPTHRLVKMPATPMGDLPARISSLFDVTEAGDAASADDISRLVESMARAVQEGPAFAAIGLQRGRLHLIKARDRQGITARIPAEHGAAWRSLDVNVLHYALFPDLGNLSRPEEIEFTDDANGAAREVLANRWDVAFLMNATPVEQVIDCAEAGDRMPQKSTFFYPKLATGVVMYPLE